MSCNCYNFCWLWLRRKSHPWENWRRWLFVHVCFSNTWQYSKKGSAESLDCQSPTVNTMWQQSRSHHSFPIYSTGCSIDCQSRSLVRMGTSKTWSKNGRASWLQYRLPLFARHPPMQVKMNQTFKWHHVPSPQNTSWFLISVSKYHMICVSNIFIHYTCVVARFHCFPGYPTMLISLGLQLK